MGSDARQTAVIASIRVGVIVGCVEDPATTSVFMRPLGGGLSVSLALIRRRPVLYQSGIAGLFSLLGLAEPDRVEYQDPLGSG
jgi:hypothetical protein